MMTITGNDEGLNCPEERLLVLVPIPQSFLPVRIIGMLRIWWWWWYDDDNMMMIWWWYDDDIDVNYFIAIIIIIAYSDVRYNTRWRSWLAQLTFSSLSTPPFAIALALRYKISPPPPGFPSPLHPSHWIVLLRLMYCTDIQQPTLNCFAVHNLREWSPQHVMFYMKYYKKAFVIVFIPERTL